MTTAHPGHRIEHDTFGDIEVAADRLWGAQTQRALEHFAISTEKIPLEVIHALALIKRAAMRSRVRPAKSLPVSTTISSRYRSGRAARARRPT
jgi:fumarate hydratase class II